MSSTDGIDKFMRKTQVLRIDMGGHYEEHEQQKTFLLILYISLTFEAPKSSDDFGHNDGLLLVILKIILLF